MDISIIAIVLLTLASFLAGFIDSIAGGGGLLMIPSYLLAGIPPHSALGTNKFVATVGTSAAVFNFIRKGKISLKTVLIGIAFSLSGAYIGSKTILLFDPTLVGKIVVFLLPIGIVATLIPKKNTIKKENLSKLDFYLKIPLICITIGFYDGFFGPGTGAFLALALNFFIRLNLVEATANAKVFNFFSSFGAFIAFMINGKVIYLLAIPLIVASVFGNYIGSILAIKKGEKFIKGVLIIVFVVLIITLSVKYF